MHVTPVILPLPAVGAKRDTRFCRDTIALSKESLLSLDSSGLVSLEVVNVAFLGAYFSISGSGGDFSLSTACFGVFLVRVDSSIRVLQDVS